MIVTGSSFASATGTDILCKFGGKTASVISPATVRNSFVRVRVTLRKLALTLDPNPYPSSTPNVNPDPIPNPNQVLNSTVLLCTTPPRDALLPQTLLARRSELDLTFDLDSAAQLPASLAISGDAQINDEALALTANVPGQVGGGILRMAAAPGCSPCHTRLQALSLIHTVAAPAA